jgi:Mrp family chromosome partitioning ATPase/NifU-like protein involved in Fe-S cluster formation
MTGEANNVRRVIAVASGKGGVGKSMVSGLLAVALRREGHDVGLLDADITGPSIPKLFFAEPVWTLTEDSRILPARTRTGILTISTNYMLDKEELPVIWRGPLIGRMIQQFWTDVRWGTLDYLIVDLPPGTSDASMTVMQSLPLSGVVLVSSPQNLAGMVVCKAAIMAQGLDVPILGLVENMSYYLCPQTGVRHEIFGPSHAEALARKLSVPLLGQVPIEPALAEMCDTGRLEDYPAQEFSLIARQIAALAPLARAPKMPAGEPPAMTPPEPEPQDQPYFSERVMQLATHPENLGQMEKPDGRGTVEGWCGDTMRIDLRLEDGRISDARFITDGCAATLACGSMITQIARGKSLAEARTITPDGVIAALDGLPEDHRHCADLAVGTLRQAIADARS